jgi:hypothetical protein
MKHLEKFQNILICIIYNFELEKRVLIYYVESTNNCILKMIGGDFINSGKIGKEEDGFFHIYVLGMMMCQNG